MTARVTAETSWAALTACALVAAWAPTSPLVAQPAEMRLPFGDVAPARHGEVLSAAALGVPDERVGRFAARRASARVAGRRRALAALHAFADDALAAARATAMEAAAVHAAIDAGARVAGVRPLVDGGAVVVVEVPVSALRAACARGGLPWVG